VSTLVRIALVTLAAALALGAGFACKVPELPELGTLPELSLRDHRGAALTSASLRGRPFVANFIFTRCPDVCPILTTKLAGVRQKLVGERVRVGYVSFSVDPANDTPEVLARYAREHHVDFDDWRFATGDVEQVKRVIVEGFKQALSELPAEQGKPANILHGSHFVLVDAALRIRGFYRSDEEGLLHLVRDARRLVKTEERKARR
jgi:protein SCO1/2